MTLEVTDTVLNFEISRHTELAWLLKAGTAM